MSMLKIAKLYQSQFKKIAQIRMSDIKEQKKSIVENLKLLDKVFGSIERFVGKMSFSNIIQQYKGQVFDLLKKLTKKLSSIIGQNGSLNIKDGEQEHTQDLIDHLKFNLKMIKKLDESDSYLISDKINKCLECLDFVESDFQSIVDKLKEKYSETNPFREQVETDPDEIVIEDLDSGLATHEKVTFSPDHETKELRGKTRFYPLFDGERDPFIDYDD